MRYLGINETGGGDGKGSSRKGFCIRAFGKMKRFLEDSFRGLSS